MKDNYYYLIFDQKDFFENQTIEELLREKATYYNSKNYIIDFWILVQPNFLKNNLLQNNIKGTNYIKNNKYSDGYYVVLKSTNLEFIKWMKLRLGYFEELFSKNFDDKLISNGVYTDSVTLKNYKVFSNLRSNRYSLSPKILAEQLQSMTLN
jgi:hypothetical protein